MQVHIAKTVEDVKDVREFTEDETWKHARGFLERLAATPFADHLRWLEADGKPVARVEVFLHSYPLGRAKLGMCLPECPFVPPELRGQGHFKRLMAGLFQWMSKNGYPLAYSHGAKGLYTARGYAPCYHHCMVLVRVADALGVQSELRARTAADEDITANEAIFRRPFPLGRGLQCRDERWRPEAECVRLAETDGEIRGFVVVAQPRVSATPDGAPSATLAPPKEGDSVTITDSWAADCEAAAALLKTIGEEADRAGTAWIRINCRRDEPLARVAVLAGGQLRWSAAQERNWTEEGEDVDAFYLADLRLAIEQLLPELDARWQAFTGQGPSAIRLRMDDQQVVLGLVGAVEVLNGPVNDAVEVRLPRKAMTRATMGYATPTELSLIHEGCQIPPDCREAVDALFPASEVHLIHENCTFSKIDGLGLVP